MEFEKLIAALDAKDEKLAAAFRAQAEEKENVIVELRKQLEDKANAAIAAEKNVKAEVEKTLKTELEEEKNKAVSEAKAEADKVVGEARERITSLEALKVELENKLSEVENERDTAQASLKEINEKAEADKLVNSRIEELSTIHPFSDEELTDEFRVSLAKASEDGYENFKLRREIAKIKAGGATAKEEKTADEKEIHSSAHASFKGNSSPSNSMEDLIKAFASVSN